jgi:hypothetical protein
MPPLFREGRSRRSWRREVAAGLLRRVDVEGEVKFVGTHPSDRAEMLRIAEMLPDDVIAELYEDPAYPGYTFMELRLADSGYADQGYPDQAYGTYDETATYDDGRGYAAGDQWASGTGY